MVVKSLKNIEPSKLLNVWVGFWHYPQILEWPARDKHSGYLRKFITYARKNLKKTLSPEVCSVLLLAHGLAHKSKTRIKMLASDKLSSL
jgi:hypothetical protein